MRQKLGSHCAAGSKRVTAEQRTELLPVHRADVVAAIEPLRPSIVDLLPGRWHRGRQRKNDRAGSMDNLRIIQIAHAHAMCSKHVA